MEKSGIIVSVRSIVTSSEGEVLLVQRSRTDKHNPGIWELPGGKIDGGHDIEDTQIREVQEETSLTIDPDNRKAYVESLIIESGRYANSTYISIIGLARVVKGEVVLSDEHDDFVWSHPELIFDYDLTKVSVNALRHHGYIA